MGEVVGPHFVGSSFPTRILGRLFPSVRLPRSVFKYKSSGSIGESNFPCHTSVFTRVSVLIPFQLCVPTISRRGSSTRPAIHIFFL